jgi:probable blue pigment (indigoidine) exporter
MTLPFATRHEAARGGMPDVALAALAPMVWGATYLVTTQLLPGFPPIGVAAMRALPAGILLLLVCRQLPTGIWLLRSLVLGALNFSVFWALLFQAAYRLPGGIAATIGAVQPMIVILAAGLVLGTKIRAVSLVAASFGLVGVALLVLQPEARLDPVGILSALGGAVSMALGTVLSRRWQPPVAPLVFTSWQLTAGGVLLLPFAFLAQPLPQSFTAANWAGVIFFVLSTAVTYILWFRGLARIEPSAISPLGFLSPLTAALLGWFVLSEALSPLQLLGAVAILASVVWSQRAR